MARVQNVFHVPQLRKYVPDPSHTLEDQPIEVRENLSVKEGEGWWGRSGGDAERKKKDRGEDGRGGEGGGVKGEKKRAVREGGIGVKSGGRVCGRGVISSIGVGT